MMGGSFEDANFEAADLTDADFSYANLTRAYMVDANLTNARFAGAKMGRSILIGANLTGTGLKSRAKYRRPKVETFPIAYRFAIQRAEADPSLQRPEKLVELCNEQADIYALPRDDEHQRWTAEVMAYFS